MSLFEKFSTASRQRKMDMFNRIMQPGSNTRILDIGAQINPNHEYGLQLIDAYPHKRNITAINISADHVEHIKHHYPDVDARVGDACALEFPDKSFDIVYSNAVIEHVGSWENQCKMAAEIMRVSKKWFVTTPNRWYPFEFHMRLPLVTWLPGGAYLTAGSIVCYQHQIRRYRWFTPRRTDLRLMTARELRSIFPQSRIVKQRITFMPETLIAIGGEVEL